MSLQIKLVNNGDSSQINKTENKSHTSSLNIDRNKLLQLRIGYTYLGVCIFTVGFSLISNVVI